MFNYNWSLKDYKKKRKYTVFGTFLCGGGSTMGYKLAGFNHIGGVELDKKMAIVYKKNHSPNYFYNEDIRDFNKRTNLPEELYNLDILDGSPPCSAFSSIGLREKVWGKEKIFYEGQKLQKLDDLVFEYCETIKKLKPKVCLLENVTGIIKGNAKWYSKEINKNLKKSGYSVQIFLLDASTMGVPQRRQRVFFIGRRTGLKWPDLKLSFNERSIYFNEIIDKTDKETGLSDYYYEIWQKKLPDDKGFDDICIRIEGRNKLYSQRFFKINEIPQTITAGTKVNPLFDIPRSLNKKELIKICSFPYDYDFCNYDHNYIMGMSVPPVMMAHIANQIKLQWLNLESKNKNP